MESRQFEVIGRFDEEGDCNRLVYAPLGEKLTYRRSRIYRFEYSGDTAALERFVNETLVDAVSQEVTAGETPALEGWRFYIDYGMKPGVLDLEKEAILNYYRELDDLAFEISGLELATRTYVYGESAGEAVSNQMVKDTINPAIHTWSIGHERSSA